MTSSKGDPCGQDDCPEPGSWRAVIRLFMEDGRRVPGEIVFGCVFCDRHKDALTLDQLVDDERWLAVKGKIGTTPKHLARERTQLLFEPAKELVLV